jgi:hypothetical protein
VRERADANRTREAGHLDEIQGAVANTLRFSRNGAVGFIDWLDGLGLKADGPLDCFTYETWKTQFSDEVSQPEKHQPYN